MVYADADRHETFPGDFDQRHTLNIFGQYQVTGRTQLAATFRSGSGLPIPAYLETRGLLLISSDRRNGVRLPPYARLDLHARRSFETLGRHVTALVEVVNVLSRANVGLAHGSIRWSTGRGCGVYRTADAAARFCRDRGPVLSKHLLHAIVPPPLAVQLHSI